MTTEQVDVSNDYLSRSVIANAKWIDKVLWVGTLVCLTVILLRLLGGDTFTFLNVKIALEHTWIVIVILTACHLYATVMFKISARKLWIERDESVCLNVWHIVTVDGGMFMRGMKPRLLPESGENAPMGNEPATWLTHICAFCLFFAIVPFELSPSFRIALAFILTMMNWFIGSHWAIALSELSISKDKSILLAGRTGKRSSKLEETRIIYQTSVQELLEALLTQLEASKTATPVFELKQLNQRLKEGTLGEDDFQVLVREISSRLSQSED